MASCFHLWGLLSSEHISIAFGCPLAVCLASDLLKPQLVKQIIISLRPAVWHTSTGSLLLIELDPVLEVTVKWTVFPQRAVWLDRLGEGGRLGMACLCICLILMTQCLSFIHPDTCVCQVLIGGGCGGGLGEVQLSVKKWVLPDFLWGRGYLFTSWKATKQAALVLRLNKLPEINCFHH